MDTMEITCPSCGTVSHFGDLARDAGAFCRVCDYPLFWARPARTEGDPGASAAEGLRRLPGTAGRVTLSTIDCPECTEPNLLAASICIRCGADLRPAPPTVQEPVILPEPEPEPEAAPARKIWPWILVAALAIAAIVTLIVLLQQ